MRVLNKFKRQDDVKLAIDDLGKQAATLEKRLKEDPRGEIKLELADTYQSLANLNLQTDQYPKFVENMRKCVQFQEQLTEKYPILKVELALNLLDLGAIAGYRLGERDLELDSDTKALAILEELRAQKYTNPTILAAIGKAEHRPGK